MMTFRKCLLLLVPLAFVLPAVFAAAPSPLDKLVGEETLAKITAALPNATVKPGQPRKVLVFTEAEKDLANTATGDHFVPQKSAPHCAAALVRIGEKTGAYEATVTSDPSVFAADKLKAYDAVVLACVYLEGKLFTIARNPTNPDKVFESRQKALLDFVESGKGLVAIHNASCPALS